MRSGSWAARKARTSFCCGCSHDPSENAMHPSMQKVARLAELAEDRGMRVEIGDTPIMLVRDGDTVHAYTADCPHAGAPLEKGGICNGRIVCPWHKGTFEISDGSLVDRPRCRASRAMRRWSTRATCMCRRSLTNRLRHGRPPMCPRCSSRARVRGRRSLRGATRGWLQRTHRTRRHRCEDPLRPDRASSSSSRATCRRTTFRRFSIPPFLNKKSSASNRKPCASTQRRSRRNSPTEQSSTK